MASQELRDWIVNAQKQGLSQENIKERLLQRGYSQEQINEAFPFEKKTKKDSFKDFFRPTTNKLLVVLFVFFLVTLVFFADKTHTEHRSGLMCALGSAQLEAQQLQQEFSDLRQRTHLQEPSVFVPLHQELTALSYQRNYERGVDSLENFFWRSYAELISSSYYSLGINQLNPFFPMPCFSLSDETNTFCRMYVSEETHSCLEELYFEGLYEGSVFEQKQHYEPITFGYWGLHTIILLGVLYSLLSLISFLSTILSEQSQKRKYVISTILFLTSLLLVIASLFFSQTGLSLLLFVSTLLFIGYSFTTNEITKKMILRSATGLIVLLLVVGLVVSFVLMKASIIQSTGFVGNYFVPQIPSEYEVIACPSPSRVSEADKVLANIPDEDFERGVYSCPGNTCINACSEHCESPQDHHLALSLTSFDARCACTCDFFKRMFE